MPMLNNFKQTYDEHKRVQNDSKTMRSRNTFLREYLTGKKDRESLRRFQESKDAIT